MYLQHFAFQHPPFAINPDPRFLYLSPKHQEALAHLLYGLGEGGGFVMLSGEVGTGKTTLCYTLLEQLGNDVDVALILNPRLNSFELLAALCDELHIPYLPSTRSRKTLIDALNQFLLANHARGRRTVAVIDEAQNLSSDVMEQVRLLTNLETPTTKLLQIVLVGQPELQELLARPELRQVDQRITARYHLGSLDRTETREYIRHRLSVAGGVPSVFSEGAVRLVYQASRGIPRLINVICDRALLGAFTLDRSSVDRRVVEKACSEVYAKGQSFQTALSVLAAVVFLGVAVASLLAMAPRFDSQRSLEQPAASSRPVHAPPVAAAKAVPEPEPLLATSLTANAPVQLTFVEWSSDPRHVEATGLARLVLYWRPDFPPQPSFSCDQVKALGLRCLRQRNVWEQLRRQNLPALITVRNTRGEDRMVLMLAAGATEATFVSPDGAHITFPNIEILPHWAGISLLLWEPPSKRTLLAFGMNDPAVVWLRQRLTLAGYGVNATGSDRMFDEALKAAVMRFQENRGIPVDGVAGEKTLAALNGIRPGDAGSSFSLNR